jgi:bifunctional DNase/RNase
MNKSYIDVKPGFTKQHSVTEVFSLKRGLMLEKHGINVQKVVIEDLFKHTFTPTRYLLTDSGRQPRKITEWKPISLETFLR